MPLNPIWLDTFVTLADTGNFTRTAQLRFMTQPGVSQHLKKLEAACNCELVVRLGKGIQLTEQGQRVYRYAIDNQTEQARFLESLKFDNPFEGQCSIGCSGAIAQLIYPSLVALQQTHTKLSINLEVAPQQRIFSDIENNSIELGIVTNEPDKKRFHTHYIGEEHLSLFLPRSAQSTNNIAKTVCELGLLNHPDAQHYMQLYFNHCGEEALMSLNVSNIKAVGYINQLSQILLPVSMGIGFTVLPSSTVKFVNVASELSVYQSKHVVSEPLYRIQTPHRHLPARYKCVIDSIEEAIQKQ